MERVSALLESQIFFLLKSDLPIERINWFSHSKHGCFKPFSCPKSVTAQVFLKLDGEVNQGKYLSNSLTKRNTVFELDWVSSLVENISGYNAEKNNQKQKQKRSCPVKRFN